MKFKWIILVSTLLFTSCGEHQEYPDHLVFSHESGFYEDDFFLTMKAPKGYKIYYTTDNSDPTELSTQYRTSIHIEDVSNKANYYSIKQGISSLDVYYPSRPVHKCQVIKVIAINPKTNDRTPISYLNYFVGYQKKDGYTNMPVITLNINDDDLFDYERGIYVTGKIYDESEHTGYPETYPANYHQKGKEWERKANFKYFDASKQIALEQMIGVRIHGGWSRAFNQKSFNLYARKEYSETSTFGYKFFDSINAHSLMLRSGGYRDTASTKVRDSLNQDFSMNEGFDIQKSFPTIVFLNGEYWGIYNLQERFSDNYVAEHHGVNKNNVLIIKNDEIDEGQQSDYHLYEELMDFFRNGDFSISSQYEIAKNYIDVQEFASYMSTQLYVNNIDWPGNNVRVWRDVSNENGKWHFMMYDTDDSMNMLTYKCGPDNDPFLKSTHWKSGPLESDCLLGLMLSKLIENTQFRTLFRNTYLRIGSENYAPSKVQTYLNQKSALLSSPMVTSHRRFVKSDFSESNYLEYIDSIQSFFNERYEYAVQYLNEHIPE